MGTMLFAVIVSRIKTVRMQRCSEQSTDGYFSTQINHHELESVTYCVMCFRLICCSQLQQACILSLPQFAAGKLGRPETLPSSRGFSGLVSSRAMIVLQFCMTAKPCSTSMSSFLLSWFAVHTRSTRHCMHTSIHPLLALLRTKKNRRLLGIRCSISNSSYRQAKQVNSSAC